ncbi:MAG: response regulator [Epsilonproteobacteria bacterium]|nr:response regulator [Campylobacterota bacterium]
MNFLRKLKEDAQDLNVLFVDDDESIVKRMQIYLQKIFNSVYTAYNGQEALEILQDHNIDIVLTDIAMPKLNGIELVKHIRKSDEQKPIIIISAFNDLEYLRDAITYGVHGYLLKPIDYDIFNRELYKAVKLIVTQRENQEYKEHLQKLVFQKEKDLIENYESTMIAMVEIIESRDSYTAGHSKRVAHYASKIAEEMGFDIQTKQLLYKAGMLHDIGKIAVPDSILLNPHRLTNREFHIIQEHVGIGVDILKKVPMFKDIIDIVFAHHERYDGKGYPRGLKGDEIPILAHILIVADSFDAMTTSRVYKGRKTVEQALEEIKELSGLQYHPEVVASAIEALKEMTPIDNIVQEPTTELEKEKFYYFYKDSITHTYNKKYLDVMLLQNSYTFEYRFLYIIYLHRFSAYNKKYGWESGDRLLKKVGSALSDYFEDALIFRIHGDDFAILSKEKISVEFTSDLLNISDHELYITSDEIDLEQKNSYALEILNQY